MVRWSPYRPFVDRTSALGTHAQGTNGVLSCLLQTRGIAPTAAYDPKLTWVVPIIVGARQKRKVILSSLTGLANLTEPDQPCQRAAS